MAGPRTHRAGPNAKLHGQRAMATTVPIRAGAGPGGAVGAHLKVRDRGVGQMQSHSFPIELSAILASSSSSSILKALIEGRGVEGTQTSLLDVFNFPYGFRNQSLKGILSEVAGQLVLRVEAYLEGLI